MSYRYVTTSKINIKTFLNLHVRFFVLFQDSMNAVKTARNFETTVDITEFLHQ